MQLPKEVGADNQVCYLLLLLFRVQGSCKLCKCQWQTVVKQETPLGVG